MLIGRLRDEETHQADSGCSQRGMSEAHMKRAAEWFLTLREIPLERAHELIAAPQAPTQHEQLEEPEESPTRSRYGTGLDAAEGLWARQGWAGRG